MTGKNLLGQPLESCCFAPMTGYQRNGFCDAHPDDVGRHTLCAVMTEEFLSFSRGRGNDLSTPRPEWGFSGLNPGDRWCLCVTRWLEAHHAGCAPPVVLAASHHACLDYVELATLALYAMDPPDIDFSP